MTRKVAILGGGVAGLSAAHELVERGFCVEVFERQGIPGGKARSIRVVEPLEGPDDLVGGRAFRNPRRQSRRLWPPGEYCIRYFPRFYHHVIDIKYRIHNDVGPVSAHYIVAND